MGTARTNRMAIMAVIAALLGAVVAAGVLLVVMDDDDPILSGAQLTSAGTPSQEADGGTADDGDDNGDDNGTADDGDAADDPKDEDRDGSRHADDDGYRDGRGHGYGFGFGGYGHGGYGGYGVLRCEERIEALDDDELAELQEHYDELAADLTDAGVAFERNTIAGLTLVEPVGTAALREGIEAFNASRGDEIDGCHHHDYFDRDLADYEDYQADLAAFLEAEGIEFATIDTRFSDVDKVVAVGAEEFYDAVGDLYGGHRGFGGNRGFGGHGGFGGPRGFGS